MTVDFDAWLEQSARLGLPFAPPWLNEAHRKVIRDMQRERERAPQNVKLWMPSGQVTFELDPHPVDVEWSIIGPSGTTPAIIRLPTDGEATPFNQAVLAAYLGMDRHPVVLSRAPGRLDHYVTDSEPMRLVDPRYVATVETLFPGVTWFRVDDPRSLEGPKGGDCTHLLIACSKGRPVAMVACLQYAFGDEPADD